MLARNKTLTHRQTLVREHVDNHRGDRVDTRRDVNARKRPRRVVVRAVTLYSLLALKVLQEAPDVWERQANPLCNLARPETCPISVEKLENSIRVLLSWPLVSRLA